MNKKKQEAALITGRMTSLTMLSCEYALVHDWAMNGSLIDTIEPNKESYQQCNVDTTRC